MRLSRAEKKISREVAELTYRTIHTRIPPPAHNGSHAHQAIGRIKNNLIGIKASGMQFFLLEQLVLLELYIGTMGVRLMLTNG